MNIRIITGIAVMTGMIAGHSFAGVTNPNISAIGQVFATYTDDTASAAPKKVALTLGEVELQLDAALNPYLNGLFVLSFDGTSVDIEEAYATLVKGLPLNLALKAGKFRLDFGKLNQTHTHAYPFLRTPRVLDPKAARLLPGEESFDDVAVQASTLWPVTDNWSVALSADALSGEAFHPDARDVMPAWLCHLSSAFIIDPASFDVGLSATRGLGDVPRHLYTAVYGADAKAKIAASALLTLTVAGEYLYRLSETSDSLGTVARGGRYGFYAYVNALYRTQFNAGLLAEQYQDPLRSGTTDRALKPFAGFSVLEESTLVRLSYEYFIGGANARNNTVEVQLLFSMGPHKAHQF
ncbi:MAG TPA: hypothetical protein VLX68_02850 [Chitinivibrionales bacterium]|nr:hypothetical protein [Chitinivibrionales bacterium]